MITPIKRRENDESKINGRVLIVCILFFIPSAVLFYSALEAQGFALVFVRGQFTGYIAIVFFLFIYIFLIKLISWFFKKIGIKWR